MQQAGFISRVGGPEGLRYQLYQKGRTQAEIARHFGVTPTIMWKHLKRHRIALPYLREPFSVVVGGAEGLRRLYVDEGLTASAIAKRFGCSRDVPGRLLRRYGIDNHRDPARMLKRQLRALLLEGPADFRELRDLLGAGVRRALWDMRRQQGFVEPFAVAPKEDKDIRGPGRPCYLWQLTKRGETVARMEKRRRRKAR